MLVLDASISAPWFLPDEDDSSSHAAARQVETEGAVVPAIWMYEIRNVLLIAERRGRLTSADVLLALEGLEKLPLTIDVDPDYPATYLLATRHSLSFYDAAYLELAQRSGGVLATLDRRLGRAVEAEGLRRFI